VIVRSLIVSLGLWASDFYETHPVEKNSTKPGENMTKSIFWAVASLCCLGFITTTSAQSVSPSATWKPADYWFLDVEVFPPPGAAVPPLRKYQINVLISGKHQSGGGTIWNVGFLPGKPVPTNLGDNYTVMVSQEKGWPVKVYHVLRLKRVPEPALVVSAIGCRLSAIGMPLEGLGLVGASPGLKMGFVMPTEQRQWLEHFGEATFLTAAPAGCPLEMFPLVSGQWSGASGQELTLTKKKDGEFTIIEAVVKSPRSRVGLVIRQKWVEGEKWWREYERYVDGEKDLVASREIPPPPPPGQITVAPEKIGTRDDPLYLHRDPKLLATIEVEAKGAKLAELVERMSKATGLKIVLDSSLADHKPDLGYIQPTPKGWSARAIMSIIQTIQLENGFWEKTASGYRLTGKSLVPPSPVAAEPAGNSLGIWLAGAGIVLSAGTAAWFYFRRQGSGKSPKPARAPVKARI
jgi:hypothetical protein